MLKFGFHSAVMKIWHHVTLIHNHKNYHSELEVCFRIKVSFLCSNVARDRKIIITFRTGRSDRSSHDLE